jgi:hypothetical protein
MKVDYAQKAQIGCPWNAARGHRAGNRGDQNCQERKGGVQDLGSLARRVGKREGVGEAELRSGVRRGKVSQARHLFCQAAVGRMGDPAAEVARFLGVTPSAVVRAAHSEGLPEIEKYP